MPNFCSNCGQPLTENANFCPNCGTKVEPMRPAAPAQPPLEQWTPQPQKAAPAPMRQSMAQQPQPAPQRPAAPQRQATVAYGAPVKPMPEPMSGPMTQPMPQPMPQPMTQASPAPMGMVRLQVKWEGAWMLWETKIKLYVNNQFAGEHNFRQPFDITIDVPAKCVLRVDYHSIYGDRRIAIDAAPGSSMLCNLTYSRFLGVMFNSLERK